MVLVAGEAGLGKTSLVADFLARHRDEALVLVGQCVGGMGDTLPYAPFTQVMKALVVADGADRVLADTGAGRAGLGVLVPALREPVPGDPERMQVFEAAASALEGAARRRPVVLVVEDLHWADASSAALVRFLDAALARVPLLLVVTYRSDEVTGRHPLRPLVAELLRRPATTRVDLGVLDPGEVAHLVRPLLAERATPPVVARIVERSEGVPYFAEELAVADQRTALPATLSEALLARVQGLSDAARRVVRLAAPGGEQVTHALIAALCDLPEADLDAALREAVDAGVLVAADDGYAFRHALLRDVVGDDLLPGELARLHSRYADLLGGRPDLASSPGQLARHLLEAQRVDEAFAASIVAAHELVDKHLASLDHFEAALGLWDRVDGPEAVFGAGRDQLLELAARAAYWNSDSSRALALVEESLAETPPDADPLVRAGRQLLKARSLLDSGKAAEEAAWERRTTWPPTTPSSAPTPSTSSPRTPCSTRRRRNAWTSPSAAWSSPVPWRENPWWPTCWSPRAAPCAIAGLTEEGFALIEEGGRLYAPRRRLRYHTNLGHHLNYHGDYARAAEVSRQGVDAARELGLERWIGAMLAGNTAEALIALGEWAEASRTMQRALALNPPRNHYLQLRMLTGWLAWCRGDDTTLAEVNGEMEPLFGDGSEQAQYETAFLAPLVEEALAVGSVERAWAFLSAELHRGVRQAPYPTWQLACLGRRVLARRSGDVAGDVAWLDAWAESIPAARTTPLFRAWYRAEGSDDAGGWRAVVSAQPEVLPAWLAVEAHTRAAEAAQRAGDPVAAKSDARAGLVLAERLGGTRWDERLRALAGRPARGGQATEKQLSPTLFTPREQGVLALVAAGHSNGEIGKALFVTAKTASVHVSNILAKLGVATRGEAAAWAHRNGVSPAG